MEYRVRSREVLPWSPLAPGARVRLDAERTWEVQGDPGDLDRLQSATGRAADRVASTVLHLWFGNAIGLFRMLDGTALEVHSGKWTEAHFDQMLGDIVSVCASLPMLAANEAGSLPYERTEVATQLSRYHAFVYLRNILGETAAESDRLAPAIEAVLREPHRRLEIERELVPIERARFIDASSVQSLVTGSTLRRVEGRAARLPLAKALGGHLPVGLDQPRNVREVDTLENRFVWSFLDETRRIVDEVRVHISASPGGLQSRLLADCVWMDAVITPWLQHPLWKEVGTLTQIPLGSTVMQGRRGYRDVLRHHLRLMLASRALPLSADATNDLLEARSIATMYELWTYFAVVAELQSILGAPIAARSLATAVEHGFMGTGIKQGFAVEWASGYRVSYNERFAKKSDRSYSMTFGCGSSAAAES